MGREPFRRHGVAYQTERRAEVGHYRDALPLPQRSRRSYWTGQALRPSKRRRRHVEADAVENGVSCGRGTAPA